MSHSYRWVIVAAGGLLGCVAIGALFSLPVLLRPISEDTGWSVTGISTAMTIGFLAMAAASMVWGNLSDRFGPRPVVLTGSAVLAASLALASRAGSLIEFQLVFGLLIGASTAAVFAPMMACVTGWFDTQRGLAVSLVSAGMGMAPMTMAPLAAWLVTIHSWRTTMLIVAGIAAVLMIPAALLVRRPRRAAIGHDGEAGGAIAAVPHPDAGQLLLLRHPFRPDLPHGELCRDLRHPDDCGRVDLQRRGAGRHVRSHRLRSWRRPVRRAARSRRGAAGAAFGVLSYAFVSQLGGFYAVALVVGFIYAGTMPLYAVIIRENFPLRMMGTIIGGTAMAGSLGMSTGPLLGGLIYDHFDSYVLMYVGSWGMGLAAMLMLMAFRPFPRRQTEMAVA
jgi:MFS family permease